VTATPFQTTLTQHVAPIEAGAHVVAAAFLGSELALALADGEIALFPPDGAPRRLATHPGGAILSAASGGGALLTGGDDGRVVATDSAGGMRIVADEKGRWIDAVALSPSGAVAWSFGKAVRVREGEKAPREIAAPSSVRGLSFFPKGLRLAFAHYDGASLWFPNTAAQPERLEWKGSHLDVTVSPDGHFVVTSMQENTLHGWRLPEKAHMRMSGYPAKTRSFSWSGDGQWLATSGADAAIVWPFQDPKGPMGKAPRECGVRPSRVSRVAFHPKALVLAVGYEDSCILLIRLTDAAELLVRRASKQEGAVTALAWDARGERLAFGTGEGMAGLLTLPRDG
jgi:WD40 repeat protein